MTGKHPVFHSKGRTSRRARLCVFTLLALAACAGCSSRTGPRGASETRGLIIVNAPASGEVRRVLVSEGAFVNAGAPIVEIVVRTQTPAAAATRNAGEDPLARASRTVSAAQGQIEAARAEVVRAEVEVQRLTPLVAAGQASPGELDGARANYDRAQQRLRQAQDAAQSAQSGVIAARQQATSSSSTIAAPAEQIVTASASSAGTVSAVNAKVGAQVAAGQPLATLRAGER